MSGVAESLKWEADCAAALGLMTEYVRPDFSKRQIARAGKVLARTITVLDGRSMPSDEVLEAFRIAHNWRSAHVWPMRRVRQELLGRARRVQVKPLTAARLKRMQSIRRKLREQPETLYQLQDIGGCRVVLNSMTEVNQLLELYRTGQTQHQLTREWPYIEKPKKDGYRSHHLILKFNGEGDEAIYNRQTIEIQVRSKLQHAWATAVEAVGLARGEVLKNGRGNLQWLRLFEIMSAEFAVEEGYPVVASVTDDERQRRAELRDLEESISAIKNLENYNQAISYTDTYRGTAQYFLIQYNNVEKTVTVSPYETYFSGQQHYIDEENFHEGRNTVLVEVDKVADLKAAFPNYFLDVQMFTDRLKSIIFGRSDERPPAESEASNGRPRRPHYLSWLANYRRPKH